MLLPESMSRIVIVGSKSRLDDATEALYKMSKVHLIDYLNDSDEGFAIGAPREYSAKASERLLKLRAVEKELGISGKKETYPVAAGEIQNQITSGEVESVDKDVFRVIDERNQVLQTVTDLKAKKDELLTLSKLPLNLDAYRGYESITVFVGNVKEDPTAVLQGIADIEYFTAGGGKKETMTVAVFASNDSKDDVQKALSDAGFTETNVPAGTGSPGDNLKDTDEQLAKFDAELARLDNEVAELREQYETFVLASDEQLSIEVEKGELPLRIATSEFSFVIDAWVPSPEADRVKADLENALDGVYVELEEARGRSGHDEDHAEPRFKKTPTKMKNGNYAKHYEYPTKLISTPKYNEIDPSTIISVFFPLFFGFMVGDIGYAIPFIILGAYGLKVAKSDEFQAIATVLFFGGIWAFLFGFFFFGEMLGMHFIGEFDGTSVTWEALLGVTFPDWFANLFPQTVHDGATHFGIGKLVDIPLLLKLSVYIGIFHLLFSYIVGFINVKIQHGWKEAFFEKFGWILSFIGMVVLCWALSEFMISQVPMGDLMIPMVLSIVLLVVGIAITWKKEKAQAILELPGIIGNILSYTRLAAIGMSKAGMALAFNYISIVMFAGFPNTEFTLMGIIALVLGALVFIVGHLMIWVLAIISAGLHALRLQYVEMMNKFFVGGGTEYAPLMTKRKHTKIVETEV